MDNLKGKKILIFQQRGWGINVGHFLAKKLKAEGCQLAAITFKKTTHEFIINQKDVKYELIISSDELLENPRNFLQKESLSLEEICNNLGVDSVWPLTMSLRHHVKSYKDKYYYGYKQNASDEEIANYIKAVYNSIKIIFDKFNPDLILTPNFVALHHIMLNIYARKHGVNMIGVTDSKVLKYYIFSYSYNDDQGPFYDHVDALNRKEIETKNRGKAQEYIKEFRNKFIQQECSSGWGIFKEKENLWKKIRHELFPYKQIWRWYSGESSKNCIKNLGVTIDYRPPRIILRDHYTYKRNKKFTENFSYYPLDKIKKYIYFPLQYQPEATIDVASPYFNNQLETARQVAMSLPSDYTLVVKEHPGMIGLRSPSFIEKIDRTVNVKLVDYRILNKDILQMSDMVISPNSTTLAEAAFYCKPAIQLGNLGTTLKLPNVFKHSDMTTLSRKIKEILNLDFCNQEYERKLENFVAAVYDVGFNFKYNDLWVKGGKENLDSFWEIYKSEIEKAIFSFKINSNDLSEQKQSA